jgi:hypothetical protein
VHAQATCTMKSKLLKYGLWTIATIIVVGLTGYIILLNTFNIFNTPNEKILSYKCDNDGLREAEVYRLQGNAVTNPSIHVSVHLDCDGYERKDEKVVFTADNNSITEKDVSINWVTFDTLLIEYKKGLRIFTQLDKIKYPDSTLDLHVTYKELE